MKRLFDATSSLLLLIALLPLLVIIFLWIKLDSRGPALFVQKRVGLNGELFSIIKFRTMVHRDPGCIDQDNEVAVVNNTDFRITRSGRLLRATSLDELPQLINILKGEMSFVGPRPILIEQKVVIPPGYMKRFSVRPGLTGLAQVRGRRSLGWLQQLAYDAEYVDKHSFWFDFGIILQTVKVVFLGNGIYGSEGLNWRAYRDSLNGRSPADEDVKKVLK